MKVNRQETVSNKKRRKKKNTINASNIGGKNDDTYKMSFRRASQPVGRFAYWQTGGQVGIFSQ